MKVASFQWPVFNPYKMATLEIFFQGCNRRTCTGGCHNPELKNYDNGLEMSVDEIIEYIKERNDLIEAVCFTGGEPLFQNKFELRELADKIKCNFPTKIIWLFTGEDEFEKIPTWCKLTCDFIKYGSYRKEFKQDIFPASSNQVVWEKSGI